MHPTKRHQKIPDPCPVWHTIWDSTFLASAAFRVEIVYVGRRYLDLGSRASGEARWPFALWGKGCFGLLLVELDVTRNVVVK
jgi:hypothetical protein